MKNLYVEYVSEELFPLFANRVLPKSRPEYKDYLSWLGLSNIKYDVLDELARTGGLRATDSLEMFPCPDRDVDKNYEVYFFSRGLRHMHKENQKRALELNPGDKIYLMQDLQNEYDTTALLLRTNDPVSLVGYAPRYYSAEFSKLVELVGSSKVDVKIERVNPDAPLQYRTLCKLSSPWPATFSPCMRKQYHVLAKTSSDFC
ncbi:MAG: HIRAN domain-containing protein [Thiohalomonadales bacterium]